MLAASNLDRQHALSSFDMRHRLNVAANYTLPFAQFIKGPKGLLDGWQLNSIISWQTGQPFTPFCESLRPVPQRIVQSPESGGRPERNIPAGYAFNPAALRVAPQGTFGNAGRNIVWGDGFRSVDLSLFKNIKLSERWKLQMRFESVNSMNHVNLQAPSTNMASNPGLFIAAAQPRILQLGAKLSF